MVGSGRKEGRRPRLRHTVEQILAKQVSRGNWTTALWAGAAGGVGTFLCYAVAYGITDRMIPY